MIRALACLVVLALGACGEAPDLRRFGARCTVTKLAELPLTIDRNFLLAPVWLEGTGAFLVVDTGAEATLLTPESAKRLALTPDRLRNTVLLGVSGPIPTQNVKLAKLDVGNIHKTGLSLAIGALSAFPETGLPVAGLLGDDVLANYDLELDAPGRRMALYEVRDCDGFRPDGFAAWHGDFATVPARRLAGGLVFPEVTVNGRHLHALLDSGARMSLLTRQVAFDIGVTERMLQNDPARTGQGVGRADIEFRQHRFEAVAVGDTAPHGLTMNVAAMRLPNVDMLLGADWLATRRVWVPANRSEIFVQSP